MIERMPTHSKARVTGKEEKKKRKRKINKKKEKKIEKNERAPNTIINA